MEEIKQLTEKAGGREYLVQRRLQPSTQLASFAPDVLQTARVVTLLDGGEPKIVAAALKISTGKEPIDNLLRGENLIAPIDTTSGELGIAVSFENYRQRFHAQHPQTDAPIHGVVLEDWHAAADLAKRAALAFPWFKNIGWDIGFTLDGPVVIEANYHADMMLIQLAHTRGLLEWHEFQDLFDRFDLRRYVGANEIVWRSTANAPSTS